MTVASLYCNKGTREAFRLLFREFFAVVERVTGHALNFHLFTNGKSTLRCCIFDADSAQMQGFGDRLLLMNDPSTSGITTRDPLELVQHLTKTCSVHFLR